METDTLFNNELCKNRHENLNKQVDSNTEQLDNHGKRINRLEQHRSKVEVQIEILIKKIDDLISILKWFFFGLIASGGGFIIWYIKELIKQW